MRFTRIRREAGKEWEGGRDERGDGGAGEE